MCTPQIVGPQMLLKELLPDEPTIPDPPPIAPPPPKTAERVSAPKQKEPRLLGLSSLRIPKGSVNA